MGGRVKCERHDACDAIIAPVDTPPFRPRSAPAAVRRMTAVPPVRAPFAFLVVALLSGHMIAAMALLVLPAIAPAVARDYGVDPALIGYQISVVTVGLTVALMGCGGVSQKLGACRTNQIGLVTVAAGLALMLLPAAAALVGGSLALGFGYGLLAPSAAALLVRFVPLARRNLMFSLQQTGVPLGGMLAALVAPALTLLAGWRWALAFNAALLILAALVMQRSRAAWDDDRNPRAPGWSARPWANAIMVWREPALRRIALAGGLFCWGQFTVATYTVVMAVATLGMNLVVAGTLLTVVQLGNAGGRLVAGFVADRAGSGQRVLLGNAWLMFAAALATALLGADWPLPLTYALFALHGMTTGAWAGLVLAEAGRLAPAGQVSAAISGVLVYVNIGKFIGPLVFANVYAVTRDYRLAFLSLAPPALAILWSLRRPRTADAKSPARAGL